MLETRTNGAEAAAVPEDERAVGEVGFGDGGRAAGAAVPDPELVEQAKRRTFRAKYKLEILERAEACTEPGQIGELLRREGLYTSHLTYWRKQRREGALKELGQSRGRKRADRAGRAGRGRAGEGEEGDRDPGKSLRALGADALDRGRERFRERRAMIE